MTRHAFQAEVSQVLHLVVNSLYSNKEIFLRELVSNASDALDKLRFRSVTEPELLEGETALELRITPDAEAGILRIEDTGIGMTEAELRENLGTVARSGTRELAARLAAEGKKDGPPLIGQFGVGFYSAFLVADRVDVVSRAAGPGQKAFRWSSDGKTDFELEPADRAVRGTEIVLHMKKEHLEFCEAWRIRELVTRYSDYVTFPIKLRTTKAEGDKTETEEAQVNRAKALWQLPKSEITKEQYEEHYKHVSHDFEPPLCWTHFKVEGRYEFAALLYVPSRAPFDLLSDQRRRRGVRLFVKRVMILDDCDELLPPFLRFVRGVVDSDDLPLNVSRELLQDSAVLRDIKKHLTKKVLDRLEDLAKESPDEYAKFWDAFGPVLKEGAATGSEHDKRLARLFRYASTAGERVSLEEYASRMPEGQEAIYYLFGPTRAYLEGSPYTEKLRAKGYEVLLMTDPVDEWACEGIREFEGKPLVNAMRADLKLGVSDEEKKAREEREKALAPLLGCIGKVLGGKVKEARVSDRLTDSPACLVLAEGGSPAYIEAMLRASGRSAPSPKRIFEINAAHPLVERLAHKAEASPDDADLTTWIEVLYEQARIVEGSPLEDPNTFVRRVSSLLTAAATSAP